MFLAVNFRPPCAAAVATPAPAAAIAIGPTEQADERAAAMTSDVRSSGLMSRRSPASQAGERCGQCKALGEAVEQHRTAPTSEHGRSH